MDKGEYQNEPCSLENRVVREPCKQRTACARILPHFKMKIAPLRTPLSKWELQMPLCQLILVFSTKWVRVPVCDYISIES